MTLLCLPILFPNAVSAGAVNAAGLYGNAISSVFKSFNIWSQTASLDLTCNLQAVSTADSLHLGGASSGAGSETKSPAYRRNAAQSEKIADWQKTLNAVLRLRNIS